MSDAFTRDGIAWFGQVAAGNVGDDNVPGMVALVVRGVDVHAHVIGSLSVGGPPVQRDSLLRIASTTKPITGAAALALADEGMLGLDDAVGRWLPELAAPGARARWTIRVRSDEAALGGPVRELVPGRQLELAQDG